MVHRNLELKIFSLLPKGFEVIDLSSLAPFGTTSVLTPVHQNNIVSTIRNLEIAADTTNILALECAIRREKAITIKSKSAEAIRLCSSQRLTRAQSFENKNFSAHFNVVALCSAGRDGGNDIFESIHLSEHINFYLSLMEELIDEDQIKTIIVKFFEYSGTGSSGLINPISGELLRKKNIQLKAEKNSQFGKNYYHRLRFMIDIVNKHDQAFNFVDGGFTDWTSKLLNNEKERLLTSGIGTDYLVRSIQLKNRNAH